MYLLSLAQAGTGGASIPIHAAPTELGRTFRVFGTINMALLTEPKMRVRSKRERAHPSPVAFGGTCNPLSITASFRLSQNQSGIRFAAVLPHNLEELNSVRAS
jgi:hypothetical protein